MIRYDGFTKQYGALTAVADLDLHVGRGDAVALIGPNGSGKTTTLKAAIGLVRPTTGHIAVDDLDVGVDGRRARAALGYLPQRLSFPDGCSAREALRFYGRLRGAPGSGDDALLDRVGLLEAASRAVDGYSGGMRQRLGIAIALLGSPRALILDEPTAALDPSGALLVRDVLTGIRDEGITILLSSHDLAEVGAVARRIGVFLHGRLAALGTHADLVRRLGLPASLRIGLPVTMADAPAVARRAGASSVTWGEGILRCEVAPGTEAAVLEALRAAGTIVTDVTVRVPDLEDVYRAIATPQPRQAA